MVLILLAYLVVWFRLVSRAKSPALLDLRHQTVALLVLCFHAPRTMLMRLHSRQEFFLRVLRSSHVRFRVQLGQNLTYQRVRL